MFWKVFFSLSAEEFEQSLRIFVFKFLVFIIIITIFLIPYFYCCDYHFFFMTILLPFM